MLLQRWDPFRDTRRMDSLANRFWRAYNVGDEVAARALPLDVVQHEEDMVVRASLPGVKADDVEVTVEDGVLRITADGRFRAGGAERQLPGAGAQEREAPQGSATARHGRCRQGRDPVRRRRTDHHLPEGGGQEGEEAGDQGRLATPDPVPEPSIRRTRGPRLTTRASLFCSSRGPLHV